MTDDLISRLVQHGQSHLFSTKEYESGSIESRRGLVEQLERLDAAQTSVRGGLVGYLERAKRLLNGAATSTTANGGIVLVHPTKLGERLRVNMPKFEEAEEVGGREAPYLAVMVVAGGLGERLQAGKHVKALLPGELVTRRAFLETQCDWVAAMQHRARVQTGDLGLTIPLAVMTSDDTHDQVMEHLTSYQGPLTEITVMKQEKVACFSDSNGRLALDPLNPLRVLCKPHGHGDVHALLQKSGLAARWSARRIRWIVFLQDSNGLAFRAIPAAIGNSVKLDLDVNMVAVARRRGEAIGAICDVVDSKGVERTLNVEYNLVQRFFSDEEQEFVAGKDDDSNNAEARAKFPGNINVLVLKCAPYARALAATEGVVPEFVNPKFSHDGVSFASPVRLECMMQDAPWLFVDGGARVGFTEMDRFLCFSPVKNNLRDALVKLHQTGFPESASSAESDLYATNRRLLAMAGCSVRTTGLAVRRFAGIPFEDGARVVLGPAFGVTVAEVRSRFPFPDHVSLTERSTLCVDGHVEIHHLRLDGALIVRASPGARVIIKNLHVINQGFVLESLGMDDDGTPASLDPIEAMRGYRMREVESLTINAPNPGDVVVDRP